MTQEEFRTGVIKPIECVKEGWEIIKPDYWLFFAITLVGMLIGGATLYILLGAMVCGIFYAFLKKIDGENASFDYLWKGFQWWLPGLIVTIVFIAPLIIVYGIIYAPFIASLMMGSKLSQDELMGLIFGALAVDLIFVILMVCFHTLLLFSYPLIVDRNLGALKAMTTSAKAVWRNLKGIAGLYGVGFVLSFLGGLACGIGTYFVIPIIIAGNIVAYRKIFPRQQTFNEPPSPQYYQGI
jgi:hypothetical protein